MFSAMPQQRKDDTGNSLWDELVLKGNSIDVSFVRDLIEDFWPKVVSSLGNIRDIEIAGPTQEAWFHVRRTSKDKTVDVLRLKKVVLSDQQMKDIHLLASAYCGILDANWNPWSPHNRHDNAFLSFLQKLSVLRARDGIFYKEGYLGHVTKCNYAECPYVQEACRIMIDPNRKWYTSLSPWFDHMSSTKMDSFRTHEYAHWFGHILSGWPVLT
jgi:hypothetical protein